MQGHAIWHHIKIERKKFRKKKLEKDFHYLWRDDGSIGKKVIIE